MSRATSSADRISPSPWRKPKVRSKSSPGVRIVTLRADPATRISMGSSTARVSGRRTTWGCTAPVTS